MEKSYKVLNRFECCGTTMVTVIIGSGNVSVMTERSYNNIIQRERNQQNTN